MSQKMQYQPMATQLSDQTTTSELSKIEVAKQIIQLNIDPDRRKFGRMLVLFNKGSFLLSLGPDYPCFLGGFTFFCVLGFLLCKTVSSIIQNQTVIWITLLLTIAQCGSYLLVALSNPSVALREHNPIKQITQQNKHRVCNKCGAESRRKTYHCRQCDVCVEQYDHHCPWTSKCIGKGNLKFFYAFVSITPFYILFFMAIMMACLVINAQHIAERNHLKGTL